MLGLVFGVALALSLPSLGQSSPPAAGATGWQRTVTVMGTAIVRSAPDEAVVSIGVQTQGHTAKEALRDNAAKMSKVIDALVKSGVRRQDIATTYVNLYPSYDASGQVLASYTATNQVDVTVTNLSKLGDVIDGAVAAGANLSSGVTFKLSDQNSGRADALAMAIQDARSQAEALATAAGARLGQVVSIEQTSSSLPPPIFDSGKASGIASPTPILPPTMETQVSVTVAWALG
jgi:uncharacterized protein YggE